MVSRAALNPVLSVIDVLDDVEGMLCVCLGTTLPANLLPQRCRDFHVCVDFPPRNSSSRGNTQHELAIKACRSY